MIMINHQLTFTKSPSPPISGNYYGHNGERTSKPMPKLYNTSSKTKGPIESLQVLTIINLKDR